MHVPPADDPKWAEIVSGKKNYPLKFLAAKIMLGRLVRTVKADPNACIAAASELHALYVSNSCIQSAKDDLKTIFG